MTTPDEPTETTVSTPIAPVTATVFTDPSNPNKSAECFNARLSGPELEKLTTPYPVCHSTALRPSFWLTSWADPPFNWPTKSLIRIVGAILTTR